MSKYDLSRVKFDILLDYLKYMQIRKANINEEALKLIVKLSEGSVRDVSLLDRGLLSIDDSELTLTKAQEIYGFFDKSTILELIEEILRAKRCCKRNL